MSQQGADDHESATSAWIAKAAGDRATARRELLAPDAPNFDAVCYHAQQSVEKLLKAVLVVHGQRVPKTHDLQFLWALVCNHVPAITMDVEALARLSSAAVEVRYPGFSAKRADAEAAMTTCENAWNVLQPLFDLSRD